MTNKWDIVLITSRFSLWSINMQYNFKHIKLIQTNTHLSKSANSASLSKYTLTNFFGKSLNL